MGLGPVIPSRFRCLEAEKDYQLRYFQKKQPFSKNPRFPNTKREEVFGRLGK